MREPSLGDRPGDAGRHGGAVVWALYALSLSFHVWAARALGVATGEPSKIAAALGVGQVVGMWRAQGLTTATALAAQQAIVAARPASLVPTWLSGAAWQVLADHDGKRLDALTALRLGVVLASSATAPLTFLLARRSLGTSLAIAAALLALFVPRGIEQGALLSGDGAVAAFVLAAIVAHLRSLRRGAWPFAVLSASLFGVALSASWSALIPIGVVTVHGALRLRGSRERLLAHGEFPLVGAIAWLPVAGATTFVLSQPYLWHETFDRLRDLVMVGATPTIGAGTWNGGAIDPAAIPRAHALTMMLASLPSWTAVASVVGALTLAIRAWRADRISDELSLAGSLAVAILAWPFVCPPALAIFPGHWLAAVPYVAMLAAYGIGVARDALSERFPSFESRAFREGVAAAVALPAFASCLSPSTSSASFPLLAGGTGRATHAEHLALHDATPLGALAKSLDAAAHDGASIYAPDVPADVLDQMARLGRLHVHLRSSPSGSTADLLLLSGNVAPSSSRVTFSAEVSREGQDVLTLVRK